MSYHLTRESAGVVQSSQNETDRLVREQILVRDSTIIFLEFNLNLGYTAAAEPTDPNIVYPIGTRFNLDTRRVADHFRNIDGTVIMRISLESYLLERDLSGGVIVREQPLYVTLPSICQTDINTSFSYMLLGSGASGLTGNGIVTRERQFGQSLIPLEFGHQIHSVYGQLNAADEGFLYDANVDKIVTIDDGPPIKTISLTNQRLTRVYLRFAIQFQTVV
jgi:hypothetical protein